MDTAIKRIWVMALRSGKFKQGKGALYNWHKQEYCCLGVLCLVAKLEIGGSNTVIVDGVNMGYCPIINLIPVGSYSRLMKMNDYENKSFPEIADYIEENL